MKVVINESIEASEDQRYQLGSVIEGKVVRRRATRNEFKEFIRVEGLANWQLALTDAYRELVDGVPADEPEEDLLGEADELDDLL